MYKSSEPASARAPRTHSPGPGTQNAELAANLTICGHVPRPSLVGASASAVVGLVVAAVPCSLPAGPLGVVAVQLVVSPLVEQLVGRMALVVVAVWTEGPLWLRRAVAVVVTESGLVGEAAVLALLTAMGVVAVAEAVAEAVAKAPAVASVVEASPQLLTLPPLASAGEEEAEVVAVAACHLQHHQGGPQDLHS